MRETGVDAVSAVAAGVVVVVVAAALCSFRPGMPFLLNGNLSNQCEPGGGTCCALVGDLEVSGTRGAAVTVIALHISPVDLPRFLAP